jgi:hypothetical protein
MNCENKRLLALQQTGILDHWDSWFRPLPPQCNANNRKQSKKTGTVRNAALSLKNLTGAFVVLLIGFSLSFLVFLVERITSMVERNKVVERSVEMSDDPALSINDSVSDDIKVEVDILAVNDILTDEFVK